MTQMQWRIWNAPGTIQHRIGQVATLPRLLAADPTIPAGRVRQDQALVIADRAIGQGRRA